MRGPISTEVTAGWASTNADGQVRQRQIPASAASVDSSARAAAFLRPGSPVAGHVEDPAATDGAVPAGRRRRGRTASRS